MPQTHPQYQLVYNPGPGYDVPPFVSCDDKDNDGTLDAVVQQIRNLHPELVGAFYSVEPVAGTEPRYRLMVCDERTGRMLWESCATEELAHGLTWAELCAKWYYRQLAREGGFYRVVPA